MKSFIVLPKRDVKIIENDLDKSAANLREVPYILVLDFDCKYYVDKAFFTHDWMKFPSTY